MTRKVREKLQDFSGYTSIHGIGRIGGVKYWFMKIFWTLIFMASFGMCIFQVYRLAIFYISVPVTTLVETENDVIQFPDISICNLNPMKYKDVKKHQSLFQVIEETAKSWNIDLSLFEKNGVFVNPNYTYTDKWEYHGNDMLTLAKRVFRLRLGDFDDTAFKSNSFSDFFISRKFFGIELHEDNFTKIRDEEYGRCYKLNIDKKYKMAEVAGPPFGLELLLNVDQSEYVPFVTESAGVRIAIHTPDSKPIFSSGTSLPTGFETNLGITVVDHQRMSGQSEKCDANNTFSDIQACIEECIGRRIVSSCNCAHQFSFFTKTVQKMCKTQTDLSCIDTAMLSIPTACSACKVPCSERTYKQSLSMTRWPSGNYEPILTSILQEFGLTLNTAREDCMLVRIFYSSLTKQTIKEEAAYTDENFVSDIGGQLGLWAGLSVLSMVEIVELLVFIGVALCSRNKINSKADEKDFSS